MRLKRPGRFSGTAEGCEEPIRRYLMALIEELEIKLFELEKKQKELEKKIKRIEEVEK